MPYQQRTSKVTKQARLRISGIQALDLPSDLGNGLSVKAYAAAIQNAEQALKSYNATVSQMAQLSIAVEQAEKELTDLSERMLSTVAGRYGRRSDEYEIAGGTRRTGRRTVKKKAETPIKEAIIP
jgi:hypothetical protein